MVFLLKISERMNQHPVLLVASADGSEGLPQTIRHCFSREINIDRGMKNRDFNCCPIVFNKLLNCSQICRQQLKSLRALVADDGATLLSERERLKTGNAKLDPSEFGSVGENGKISDAPLVLGKENLGKALDRTKKKNASALGTPKVN